MTRYKYILLIFLCITLGSITLAQNPGVIWSNNIILKFNTDFGRGGAADVWGVQINGVNYALVTLDGGLSIVNTNNPASPLEVVNINRNGYDPDDNNAPRIWMPVVETFTKNGITYAYLATNNSADPDMPLVIIINLNAAINQGDQILIDPYNPSGSVYVGKINDIGNISRSHTLTIDGGYLYVATLKDKIPVWNLNSNPTNPTYLGTITLTQPYSEVHEMYVKSTGSTSSKIYAACSRGGLQVIDLNLSNMSFTKTTQIYDADKKYANQINSIDPLFDFRQTHSAWPTDD